MVSSSFLLIFIAGIVCSFCGQDFVSLGRHAWRCKQRMQPEDQQEQHQHHNQQNLNNSSVTESNDTTVKCCCGKICKGNRGLKMHQRSCRVISGLNDELRTDFISTTQHENDNNEQDDDSLFIQPDEEIFPDIKVGINLPKSDEQWLTANEYFKSVLQLSPPIRFEDLNSCIQLLNDSIYNYFSENFGQVKKSASEEMVNKYKDKTAKELKKTLKNLKRSNADLREIKYVSHLLRDLLHNKNTVTQDTNNIDHDNFITKNFWSYTKKIFEAKETILPSFTMAECVDFFKITLSSANPTKLFHLPNWIPTLNDPVIPFDLDPPTYEQITHVIRKMKASGSPCPLDQISIICFKRCPYLRTCSMVFMGVSPGTGCAV